MDHYVSRMLPSICLGFALKALKWVKLKGSHSQTGIAMLSHAVGPCHTITTYENVGEVSDMSRHKTEKVLAHIDIEKQTLKPK